MTVVSNTVSMHERYGLLYVHRFKHSICRAQTMVFKAKYLFSIFQCVERNYGNECTIWCVCVCVCMLIKQSGCYLESGGFHHPSIATTGAWRSLKRRVTEETHVHTHTSYTLTATEHNELNVSVNFELNTKINKNWKEIEKNRKEK